MQKIVRFWLLQIRFFIHEKTRVLNTYALRHLDPFSSMSEINNLVIPILIKPHVSYSEHIWELPSLALQRRSTLRQRLGILNPRSESRSINAQCTVPGRSGQLAASLA